MSVEQIKKIAVMGAGLMGHGIALEFAANGYEVSLYDLNDDILRRGLEDARANLAQMADAGMITAQQASAAPARMHPFTSLEQAAADADVVIEAVAEKLEIKHDVFRRLDACCRPDTILASNSSTLMPSKLAPAVRRPERLLVAHYWNPPFLLPLVEVVGCPQTSAQAIATMRELLAKIGKMPVVMKKEALGFIGNRLQFALWREALHIVDAGIASPEDVDAVVRNSFGRRLAVAGPFEVFESGGLDVIHGASSYLFPDLDNRKEPSPLVGQHVEKGELGIKTGKGFYRWTPESGAALRRRIADALIMLNAWARKRQ
jgi:3-hydroxybutyryl-CoA dehydrogenase